ncbi:hypothetical protein V6N11_027180 [Hibiscus sabdariffa]|uniref:Phytocyanin domain-containing protein n=1 Tax=Hibiscus sabdariffa TaxID=183260 RepID=A0ABR2PG79_9ROSI
MAVAASSVIIPAMVFFMVFQPQYEAIRSYTPVHYIVGDEDGWDPVITGVSWSNGKKFYAGGVLGTSH